MFASGPAGCKGDCVRARSSLEDPGLATGWSPPAGNGLCEGVRVRTRMASASRRCAAAGADNSPLNDPLGKSGGLCAPGTHNPPRNRVGGTFGGLSATSAATHADAPLTPPPRGPRYSSPSPAARLAAPVHDDECQRDREEAVALEAPEGQRAERVAGDHEAQQRQHHIRVERAAALGGEHHRASDQVQYEKAGRQGSAELLGPDSVGLEPEHDRRSADTDRRGERAAEKPAAQPAAGGSVRADSEGSPAARRPSCQPAARITATPTLTCSASFESSVSATAPAARPGSAATNIGASARQSTCSGRPRSNRTSRLSARPRTSSEVTASTGSSAAKSAGLSTRAKPKPVADWIEAPTSAAAAASGISRRQAPPGEGVRRGHPPAARGRAMSFDRHELLRECRQDLGFALPHNHQVLDPHTDLAGHVDARLDASPRCPRGARPRRSWPSRGASCTSSPTPCPRP